LGSFYRQSTFINFKYEKLEVTVVLDAVQKAWLKFNLGVKL